MGVGLFPKTLPKTLPKKFLEIARKSLPRSILDKQRNFSAKAQHLQIRPHKQRLALLQSAFHPNSKIKPNVVLFSGVEEKHIEGRYFLNFNNHWIDVGENALEAQCKRLLRLNQIEFERLSGTSLPASPVGRPSVVEFSGRKVIKDEAEAYLADLELTRRPARTVQSKRKYLGDFVGLFVTRSEQVCKGRCQP